VKIAVVFDFDTLGGGFHQSLSSALNLSKLDSDIHNIYFIACSRRIFEKLKSHNLNTLLFKNIIFCRIFFQLSISVFFNFIFNIFKIRNPFVKFIKENNFDFIIFLGPSWLIKVSDEVNFVMSPYDINFRLDNFFPEYLSNRSFQSKNVIIKKSVNQAFKIVVDTDRSKEELINFYNCPENKIVIQSFIPYLTNIETNTDVQESNKIIKNLGLDGKKFIFYPAQFFPHKNHRYIIDAVRILKEKKNVNISVVFCGADRGSLSFVKEIIDTAELSEDFHIYNYLSDAEVIALYKNACALVMPTYVARSTLPLLESFFFKIPVFYSKGVLDKSIEKIVETFDLKDPNDLSEKLYQFLNGKINFKEKIEFGHHFFIDNCSEERFIKNYRTIIDEYSRILSIWKK
jgi:glycosyltransferase involved in cell wall biosynthesis